MSKETIGLNLIYDNMEGEISPEEETGNLAEQNAAEKAQKREISHAKRGKIFGKIAGAALNLFARIQTKFFAPKTEKPTQNLGKSGDSRDLEKSQNSQKSKISRRKFAEKPRNSVTIENQTDEDLAAALAQIAARNAAMRARDSQKPTDIFAQNPDLVAPISAYFAAEDFAKENPESAKNHQTNLTDFTQKPPEIREVLPKFSEVKKSPIWRELTESGIVRAYDEKSARAGQFFYLSFGKNGKWVARNLGGGRSEKSRAALAKIFAEKDNLLEAKILHDAQRKLKMADSALKLTERISPEDCANYANKINQEMANFGEIQTLALEKLRGLHEE